MNYRNIIFVFARLISIEGVFLILSAFVALYYGGSDFNSLLFTGLGAFVVGWLLSAILKQEKGKMTKREGYLAVSLVWIVFSLVGAVPFVISGYIPHYVDAFFETISGFTTTGVSIIPDVEVFPKGLLFWRSLTQWLGGMGIIVLSLAILPALNVGGMQLFAAEVAGPTKDKLHPRITQTAKKLWLLYAGFTFLEALLLYLGGMSAFDAITQSFTTLASGGFSTRTNSIGSFHSAYFEYIITIFMFIAGTNFSINYQLLRFNFSKVRKNEEFKFYSLIFFGISILVAVVLYFNNHWDIEKSFRIALFHVASTLTCTGFTTNGYLHWPTFVTLILIINMIMGGSAGSTAGGIKMIRVHVAIKNSFLELRRLIHPRAIIPLKYNGHSLSDSIVKSIMAFVFIYLLIFFVSVIVVSAMGYDLLTAMGSVATTLGGVGATMGQLLNYSGASDFGKLFFSFLMLIGRLEVFTVFMLFSRHYWKN